MKDDFLGTEPVGRLLLRLALPTVTAQVINMLYNIAVSYTHLDVYKRQNPTRATGAVRASA